MKNILVLLPMVVALSAGAKPIEWTFPLKDTCHQGLPFSDGITGVLVWGGGDTINLTVGRADLWDHRGGYQWLPEQNYTNICAAVRSGDEKRLLGLFQQDVPPGWGGRYNPYMLPLGRVVVKLPGGVTLKRGELDVTTGLGKLFLSDGKIIEIAMSKQSRLFAMNLPKGLNLAVSAHSCMEYPEAKKALEPRGFKPARPWADEERGLSGGFIWDLPADIPVSLAWARRGDELVVATARGKNAATAEGSFAATAKESVTHWQAFWARSARVKVPDPVLQREFDYGMYRFGSMTDPDGVPAGLQGPWLEDDRLVPWNGDYHFNINVQECYSPAFRGGHFEHLKPLFKMVLGWRERLRENARQFVGIDNGYVLPHSVDDRGVCIGGFWTGTIDHGSTAWMASYMFRYVKYSGDVAFLRDGAYDFMKGAMNVYRAMMEEKDGALSIPLAPSPEWGGSSTKGAVGRDPSFQLAAAHRLVRDLIAAAKMLGEEPDAMWLDVAKRLPTGNVGPHGLRLFDQSWPNESHRHHSHMAGYYPFDIFDLRDPATAKAVEATYATWEKNGTSQWTGWCVPWASVLYTHIGRADQAVAMLQAWDYYFCDQGHGSHHNAVRKGFTEWIWGLGVMQMDGQCAAVTAVMELLAHEVNGEVEFFRGCPESWKEVSFENLRLSDGRVASGSRINGTVSITYRRASPSPTGSVPQRIARTRKIIGEDNWHGFRRTRFQFGDYVGWVVEPLGAPAEGRPWTWTMQWADAFVERTGVPELLRRGWHHVTLEAFAGRAREQDLERFAAFQQFLVDELGFAPKAHLIGMSWGGFFSTRYAARHPENIAKIYLDAPLMNLEGFTDNTRDKVGPWAAERPAGKSWTEDPRMPINLAAPIAQAKIPILLAYGGQDEVVPPALNCELFVPRFKAAGGKINVYCRPFYGHHPHGFDLFENPVLTFFK